MAQQDVSMDIRDGGLGNGLTVARPQVLIGCAAAGDTARVYTASGQDASTPILQGGELAQAVAAYCKMSGQNVLFLRCATTAPGTNSAVASRKADGTPTATGTSVVTVTGIPHTAARFVLRIKKGGTIGAPGIVVDYSRDNGKTFGAERPLGSANELAIPELGAAMELNFAAGTLIVGESYRFATTGPTTNAASIVACLAALKASKKQFEIIGILPVLTKADADTIDLAMIDLKLGAFKYQRALGTARDIAPTDATPSDWFDDLEDDFGPYVSNDGRVHICAGWYEITSTLAATEGDKFRGSLVVPVLSRLAQIKKSEEPAFVDRGALVGVSANDDDGDHYFNSGVEPRLDQARFVTLTTYEGREGLYVYNTNSMAKSGSSYDTMPRGRVIDVAARTLRATLLPYLKSTVRVDIATGNILEADAQLIEKKARFALEMALLSPGDVSPGGITVRVDRSINILSEKRIKIDASIVPLGQVSKIEASVGLDNPAVQAIAA